MEIIINHLTRMAPGYFCVAGLTRTGRHVRPVTGRRLPRSLLESDGGVFGIRRVVDLGPTTANRSTPEVEDRLFNPDAVRLIETLSEDEFSESIEEIAKPRLMELFGSALHQHGHASAVVDPGAGNASLGVFACRGPVSIVLNSWGKIRCRFEDEDLGQLDLSVTDVRLFLEDWEPDEEAIGRVSRGLSESPILLSVGLTRAMGEPTPLHWLQVNNIHIPEHFWS